MKIESILAISSLTLMLVSCGSGDVNADNQLDDKLSAQLTTITNRYYEEFPIPGLLAGIWIPGKAEIIIGKGVSNIEQNTFIEPSDHTRIASITKSFTVTVILQLAQERRIDLQKPISFYLPDLNIQNNNATVFQLSNMRSGIFNYTEDQDFVTSFIEDPLKVVTDQYLIDIADRNKPYFPPDADWHYSNTNTVILGMLIEKITGHTVADEISTRIIQRLGLTETTYPRNADIPVPFLSGYAFQPLENVTQTNPSYTAASGAMISTLNDLKKWGKILGEGTSILSHETQQLRLDSLVQITFSPCRDDQPRNQKNCPEYDRYGLGLGEIDGWIGHTGDYIGYTSLVMYNPQSKATIVILTNLSAASKHIPTAIFKDFVNIIPK